MNTSNSNTLLDIIKKYPFTIFSKLTAAEIQDVCEVLAVAFPHHPALSLNLDRKYPVCRDVINCMRFCNYCFEYFLYGLSDIFLEV